MKQADLLPPHMPAGDPPPGAVLADQSKLKHINTYGELPTYYIDYEFICEDCGSAEKWTAEQQKWYYEEAKGHTMQAVPAASQRQFKCNITRWGSLLPAVARRGHATA